MTAPDYFPFLLLPWAVSSHVLLHGTEWCVKYLHHTTLSICLYATPGFYGLPCRFYFFAVPLSFWQSQFPLDLCHAISSMVFYCSLLLLQAVSPEPVSTRFCLILWPNSCFQVTNVSYFFLVLAYSPAHSINPFGEGGGVPCYFSFLCSTWAKSEIKESLHRRLRSDGALVFLNAGTVECRCHCV